MPYEVNLHADPAIGANVKRRGGFTASALWSGEVVNIGDFSSLNLFADNNVSISCPYTTAITANYITVQVAAYTVVGAITDITYVNDNHTNISYIVDAFHSARTSGLITDMQGLCERTNLTYSASQSLANMTSEPFSPSNNTRSDTIPSQLFNAAIIGFEGVTPESAALNGANTKIVVTVSPTVMAFLQVSAWASNPSVTIEMQDVDDLNFKSNDATPHAGGIFRGTPLVFDELSQAKIFIRDICNGCGFRTVLPPDGYDSDGTVRKQMVTPNAANVADGYMTGSDAETWLETDLHIKGELPDGEIDIYLERDGDDPEIESLRFITADDIYNIYCLPTQFAVNQPNSPYTSFTVSGFPTLGTLHNMGGEDNSKSKLIGYPYNYSILKTANGDSVDIIPQIHYQSSGYGCTSEITVDVRFIGGDKPRLMGMIRPRYTTNAGAFSTIIAGDWFTIRSYPLIPLSIDNSYNPQLQREIAQVKNLSAIRASATSNQQLNNPFKAGYLDGVTGANRGKSLANQNANASQVTQALYQLGTQFGSLSNNGSFNVNDTINQDVQNAAIAGNVNSTITSDAKQITGDDFYSQYAIAAVTIYRAGATDGELFQFARYMEMFGQSTNSHLNPLTNAGNILGGEASVGSFNGKTYYQFGFIDVVGNMPYEWKESIRQLFESGVYLI